MQRQSWTISGEILKCAGTLRKCIDPDARSVDVYPGFDDFLPVHPLGVQYGENVTECGSTASVNQYHACLGRAHQEVRRDPCEGA